MRYIEAPPISFAWSPDSRWLAYTDLPHALVSALYLSDADKGVKLAAVSATASFQSATSPDLKRIANKNLIRRHV